MDFFIVLYFGCLKTQNTKGGFTIALQLLGQSLGRGERLLRAEPVTETDSEPMSVKVGMVIDQMHLKGSGVTAKRGPLADVHHSWTFHRLIVNADTDCIRSGPGYKFVRMVG